MSTIHLLRTCLLAGVISNFAVAAQDLANKPELPNKTGKEKIAGLNVTYDSVRTPKGYRVRTIVTRPQNATGRLPAVMLVGWLSCDSVNYPGGPPDGFARTLHRIATESGFVTVRMEKPGVGDSEGPVCEKLDFHEELAAYRATFQWLQKLEGVDPVRIFLLGMSNGGGFAPLVPQNAKVKGYIVTGGWAKTWFEHMIEHERRRLRLGSKPPAEVSAGMQGFSTFYDLYLNQKMTPAAVLAQHPELKGLWYDAGDGQYGRPAAFYQQLQALNLAGAWDKVDAPVLAIHGEYDWIMSRDDHEMIVHIVNRNHPGSANFVEVPKTDHGLQQFQSEERAFRNVAGTFNQSVADLMVTWLKKHASQ